jgi:hypothetical protein
MICECPELILWDAVMMADLVDIIIYFVGFDEGVSSKNVLS